MLLCGRQSVGGVARSRRRKIASNFLSLIFSDPLHDLYIGGVSCEQNKTFTGENEMKKTIIITSIVVLAMAALGVGVVFAQGTQPPSGFGMGWMHDYVEQALAAKLGLTEQQVEDQFAAGKTMVQIALDNGIKQEDVASFLSDVHKEAFANAVKDGVMTQQQADWMLQRMQSRGWGTGTGNCPMHSGQAGTGYGRGMMGNGWGRGMMGGGWGAQQNP
jgi:hypothetical protein